MSIQHEAPSGRQETVWRDPKRYAWLLGLSVPTLPFMAGGLVGLTGWGAFWWWGLVFSFGVIPILDRAVGADAANPPEEAVPALERDRYYRWCTYLYLPLQYVALVWACGVWTSSSPSLVDKVGLALTVGVVSGVAINTAHELGHKTERSERWLSKIALAQTGYGHFCTEHNHGHHIRVATPEDPASSRYGESFWAFWPRTVLGSARSAWRLEARRLSRRGRRVWSWRNDVLNAWGMTVVLVAVLVVAFGPGILPYLLIQAVFGFTLLETVNYVEHYGLARQRRANGRYERVQPRHSWNSNHTTSNILLYQLQRHSDHHANPLRRYQALRHYEEAPQLPSGYASMIVLAWATPLWRRVIDPRLLAHYGGDLRAANVCPRASRRVTTGREATSGA